MNNLLFSKLCVCCWFTIDKMQNMCKLVKVELESFCQIGSGNWLVVQTFAMVLEIIGRNNNYPLCALASSGRLATDTTNTPRPWQVVGH